MNATAWLPLDPAHVSSSQLPPNRLPKAIYGDPIDIPPQCRQVQWQVGTQEATMLVGYGRTSSITQEAGLEAQERDLKAVGVEKLFTEQVSSVAERAQLE